MSTLLNNLGRITELTAVNTVLVSAGENPYPSTTLLENIGAFDVKTIINLLQDVTREMQLEPWEFNTETGRIWYPQIEDYVWTDNNGDLVGISIFLDPTDSFLSWKLTSCRENYGLDVDIRLSEKNDYPLAPGQNIPVLYDKRNHRDGPETEKHPFIYLDVQYVKNFNLLPEEAKRYISVVAARRFCQQALGSAEKGTFSAQDEAAALRLLKRAHGRPEKFNIKNNPEVQQMLGHRGDGRMRFGRRLRNKGE